MKKILTTTARLVSLALSSLVVNVADFKPAIAYDSSGKFDKSFSQAVYQNGALKFTEDTKIEVRDFVPSNDAQREQGLARLAKRGYSPIVAVGFMYGSALEKVAKQYPESQFVIIDSVVDLPNVKSLLFKEHEGSFLVGALAALKSESNKVGFVGGMDIPLIRKFACGYEQGAKYVNNDAEVFQNMTGSTNAAWSDPARGAELTKSQFTKGADVVFAVPLAVQVQVFIKRQKMKVNMLLVLTQTKMICTQEPMLTSMVKRVGLATYTVFQDAKDGNFTAGIESKGLKEAGVDWALDEHNRGLVTAEMETEINNIKTKIVAGEITVHDYMTDSTCTY
ncbi:BMP family lipoprotein [Psychromonas sp. KJ10-10]|uniref:BMP family lipoprotein n=1 Tax=Psychromonas sp. KJ10-10 TaxID=3391823 RepID=UPI0039B5AD41